MKWIQGNNSQSHFRRKSNQIEVMKTIDQNGVLDLVKDMLADPTRYADKPMFIWQADWLDGLQSTTIIRGSCEFNKGKARENWSYFRLISFSGEDTHLKAPHPEGTQCGYILNTRKLPLSDYLARVNRLIAENTAQLPMIVYLPYHLKVISLPGEQLLFTPNFEQWASEWSDPLIPDFIRGDGDHEGKTYRWYNRYNDPNRGCFTPLAWDAVNSFLNGCIKLTRNNRKAYSIRDLSEEHIRSAFYAGINASSSHISDDIINDFLKHVNSSHPNSK